MLSVNRCTCRGFGWGEHAAVIPDRMQPSTGIARATTQRATESGYRVTIFSREARWVAVLLGRPRASPLEPSGGFGSYGGLRHRAPVGLPAPAAGASVVRPVGRYNEAPAASPGRTMSLR